MNFDLKNIWVTRCRARAKLIGCAGCQKTDVELGVKNEMSLTKMVRGGSTVAEMKTVIRKSGWWCRKCVRKWKGTAATTTSKRDEFPPGPEGERKFQWWKFKMVEEESRNNDPVVWDDVAGRMIYARLRPDLVAAKP